MLAGVYDPEWSVRQLLDEALPDRRVGEDAPLDEPLAVAPAARAQPLLVEPEHVGAPTPGRAFADVGKHVHEANELPRQLGEHLGERVLVERLSEP